MRIRMMQRCWVWAGVVLLAVASAARADMLPDQERHHYTGTLGSGLSVQVDLTFDYTDMDHIGVTGSYFYEHVGQRIELEGQFLDGEGRIDVRESVAGEATGYWTLTGGDRSGDLVGEWRRPGSERGLAVALTRVAGYERRRTETPGGYITTVFPILKEAGALGEGVDAVAEETQSAHDKFIAFVREINADPALSDDAKRMPYAAEYAWAVAYYAEDLVVLRGRLWEYTGGAHGMPWNGSAVYTVRDGEPALLELGDLFRPDAPYMDRLNALVVADLVRQEAAWIGTEAVDDYRTDPFAEEDFEVFTIGPAGLTIHFGVYHVGPYAQGFFDVLVPWEEIEAMVDPDGVAGRWLD